MFRIYRLQPLNRKLKKNIILSLFGDFEIFLNINKYEIVSTRHFGSQRPVFLNWQILKLIFLILRRKNSSPNIFNTSFLSSWAVTGFIYWARWSFLFFPARGIKFDAPLKRYIKMLFFFSPHFFRSLWCSSFSISFHTTPRLRIQYRKYRFVRNRAAWLSKE